MKTLFSLILSLGLACATASAEEMKTILFFGDSLTAGYGLDDASTQAYPTLIQQKITAAGLPYQVVNAGSSGETTAGGLRRIDWILRSPVDVFVLALGANDGLRGLPPGVAMRNLQGIIGKVRTRNPEVRIVLVGMMMPTSMGGDYAREFSEMYPALAKINQVPLVPFLLEGVGGVAELNLADGVHPTAEGHKHLAETVWKTLEPVLRN